MKPVGVFLALHAKRIGIRPASFLIQSPHPPLMIQECIIG
jgi:hypothetical protein